MSSSNCLQYLVEKAMLTPGREHMRPVIEKELLHYDILFALDKAKLLDKLTFQGGSALRLCYKANRFSEDLYFTEGSNFSSSNLQGIKTCLEHSLGERYGLEVSVKEPNDNKLQAAAIKVAKWQISITTAPQRKDIPKQRIKLEVANIPSYSREPKGLITNYDFLPDGYGDIIVLAENKSEIMADKIVSLVNTNRYIRYRDIWDLRWLKQQGAELNYSWIQSKFTTYLVEQPQQKIKNMLELLPSIINSDNFKNEIGKFIPINVQERTIQQDKFCQMLNIEVSELLTNVNRNFN